MCNIYWSPPHWILLRVVLRTLASVNFCIKWQNQCRLSKRMQIFMELYKVGGPIFGKPSLDERQPFDNSIYSYICVVVVEVTTCFATCFGLTHAKTLSKIECFH